MHMTRFISTALVGVVLLSSCATTQPKLKLGSAADGEVVEAEGLAAVVPDKISMKRAALEDARKNAVEKVVGVLISAKTVVDKAITIQQNILAKTDGYVRNYEVLKEGVESDGIYHTHIRAFVAFQDIKKDLEASDLLHSPIVGNPRVAVLLQENIQDLNQPGTPCTDGLMQGLLEQGYQVVDRSELAAIHSAKTAQQLLSADAQKTLQPLAQALNAEVVIAGKAESQFLTAEGLGGLISYRGSLTAKALKAGSGEVLATVTTQASGLDATKNAAATKAMSQLGKNAAKELGPKIVAELLRKATVQVSLRKVANLEQLGKIRNLLTSANGVEDVYLRYFTAGTAQLDVKIKSATALDLAGLLIKEFNAQTLQQTPDSLDLQLP